MFPFYKEDLRVYRLLQSELFPDIRFTTIFLVSGGPATFYNSTEYIITIVHGVLLAALAILFMLCVMTAILAGCCLSRNFSYHTLRQLTKEAVLQSR